MSSKCPTLILVHGAFEDSSMWQHIVPRLLRDGYPVRIFATPLRGVAIDAAHLLSLIEKIEGPIILVSHAYGGAVISQAGNHPKVKGLVYAGSPMPGVGESMTTCLERFPGGDLASSIDLFPYTLPDGTGGTNVYCKPDQYLDLLAADVPESVGALMIASQRPIDVAALGELLTSAAWTTKPSWQIRPLQDPVFPKEEWKFQADRAQCQVIEVNSSHALPISHPDVVIDVIQQAVRTTAQ